MQPFIVQWHVAVGTAGCDTTPVSGTCSGRKREVVAVEWAGITLELPWGCWPYQTQHVLGTQAHMPKTGEPTRTTAGQDQKICANKHKCVGKQKKLLMSVELHQQGKKKEAPCP